VAFEISFPTLFAVETGIAEYQQRVQAVYPNSSAQYVVRFPNTTAFGKSPRPEQAELKPLRIFVFENVQKSRVVTVSLETLTLLVKDYLHFEDFKKALAAALTPAIEIFHLSTVQRIGLRYINRIPIPTEQAESHYRKYVRSPLGLDAIPKESHLNNFLTELSMSLDAAKKLTIRCGLLPVQVDQATRTYLLDFDCYSLANISLSENDLRNTLDEYHAAIESEFVRAATPEYWKYMVKGEQL
jgi:uncharacterized protein (TIGR04255 family)